MEEATFGIGQYRILCLSSTSIFRSQGVSFRRLLVQLYCAQRRVTSPALAFGVQCTALVFSSRVSGKGDNDHVLTHWQVGIKYL